MPANPKLKDLVSNGSNQDLKLPNVAKIEQLNKVLGKIHDTLILACEGDDKAVDVNKKIGELIQECRAADLDLFTLFELNKISNLEISPHPRIQEFLTIAEGLYVSISARIKSGVYSVLSHQPDILLKALLEDLKTLIDGFLLNPDIASLVRLHSLVASMINYKPRIDSKEFDELYDMAKSIIVYCRERANNPNEQNPDYFKHLDEMFVRIKIMLNGIKTDTINQN